MFKSQQYRAEAVEYGELAKESNSPDESRKLQELQHRLVSLAENEQGLANSYATAVHVGSRSRGRTRSALPWRRRYHAMERAADAVAAGDFRHRRIGRQVVGDRGAPRADRPVFAQA
jgi:hypothetical protein